MEFWRILIAIIVPYFLGSVSVAIIITKYIIRKDVRKYGSHNAGATNVARSFGMRMGVLTLLGDCLKTALSMCIGFWVLGEAGKLIAAAACLLGHCFPIYFHFKGGKGVATGACIALMLDWRLFLIVLCVFLIVFLLTRYVSLSSMCASFVFPIGQLVLRQPFLWNVVLGVFITATVIFMHRENIKRLKAGTETKFYVGKKTEGKQ